MAAELAPAPEKRRRGRPVDTALGQRILSATMHQLSELGYTNLEIESVAAAAACSKTTIYRRWGSKGQLVAAAIVSEYREGPAIDTGNLIDDLIEHSSGRHSLLAFDTLPPAAWAAALEPEVASVLRESVLTPQDVAADALIARAVERGELPADADGRAIVHAALGLGLYRRYLTESEGLPPETLRQVLFALISTPPRVAASGA